MKHTWAWQLVGLFGLVGLYSACPGQVHNLGENGNAGTGGIDPGKTTPIGGAGGAGLGATTATGGFGGNGTPGVKPLGTGGMGTGGNGAGGVGILGGTPPVIHPYVTQPTLPIDPTCTCASSSQICNAAKECVDRCDYAGLCAVWLTNHAVKSLYIEGSTLYYATAPTTDSLGNASTDGSLFRVEYPSGVPLLIATGLQNPQTILGRYNGSTYLVASIGSVNSLYSVSDIGAVKKLDDSSERASMRGKWLAYSTFDYRTLKLIDLSGNLVPKQLVTLTPPASDPTSARITNPTVTDNYVWYGSGFEPAWCSVGLSDLALGSTCYSGYVAPYDTVIANGDNVNVICGQTMSGRATSKRIDGTVLLTLLTAIPGDANAVQEQTVLSGGWLYSLVSGDSSASHWLFRYPTNVARLPQMVLSKDEASPTFAPGAPIDNTTNFVVSDAGVFWAQPVADVNQPQYIFRASLPPQPCDTQVPCANSALVCSSGFCAAP